MVTRILAASLLCVASVLSAPTEADAALRVQCYDATGAATVDMNTLTSAIDSFCAKAATMTYGPQTVDSYQQTVFYIKNQVVLEAQNSASCSFKPKASACKTAMKRPLKECISQGSWTYGGHVSDGCSSYSVKPQ